MNSIEFADSIINGVGGMRDFAEREFGAEPEGNPTAVAMWTLRCLANPKCEGSSEATAAIMKKRGNGESYRGGRIDFAGVQAGHREWAFRNFGEHSPDDEARVYRSFIGVVEEVGELGHSLLKQHQGIRGSYAEHEAKAKDAVGDVILFLTDLCNRKGWELQEIIEETTAEVWARDWTKNRKDGV